MRSIARTAVTAVTFSIFGYLPSTNVIPSAAAQFTDNPPGVSLHGPSGIITASPAPFTIDWCDDHGVVNHTVTVNGVDMTSSLTFVTLSPGTGNCTVHKQSTGSLAMTAGNNTVIATATDSHLQTGIGQAVYRYTDVSVVPPAAPNNIQRSTTTAIFTVKNLLNSAQTFTISAFCTGQLTGCSAPASVSIGALAQSPVTVTYTTDTVGTSGAMSFKAWLSTNSTMRDSASIAITAQLSLTADGSFNNNDNQAMDLCEQNCFAATAQAATAPYFSLGMPRSTRLFYHGDRVAVRPFVYADVTVATGAASVQEYWLQVKDSASGAFLPFTNGDVTKVRFSGALPVTRLVGQVDASQYATSMRRVFVIVTAHRANYDEQVTLPTNLMIVNERSSAAGRGWTIGDLQRLYPQADGTALVTQGNASAVYYGGTCTVPCTYISPPGEFTRLRTLKFNQVITYVREYVDSTKVFFRSAGLMDSIADRFGNVTRFEYDASSRLSKIFDPFRTYNGGASRSYIALTYGTYGLTQIQEPGADGSPTGGRITKITVATDSTLTVIKDPDGDSSRFTYDSNKRLQSIVDRNGSAYAFVYDATSWKVISQTSPQIAVDAGNGGTVLAAPTITMRPWQLVGLPTASTTTIPALSVRADTVRARVVDPVGNLLTFTVNRWGQALVTTDPVGRQTTIDRAGGILASFTTHPSGGQDVIFYQGGLPTSIHLAGSDAKTIFYGAYGQISTTSGVNQVTTKNYIGPLGRIDSTSIGSRNSMTRFTYDSRGRLIQSVDPAFDTVFTHYDSRFGNPDSVTSPGGRYKWTRYDGRGRDSAVYVSGGTVAITLYDSLGRIRQHNDGVHPNPTTYAYDKLHLVRMQDPQHQVYRFGRNALGWLTTAYDPADTTNRFKSYRYRADGTLGSVTNRRGQRIDFRYDSLGRVISERGPSNIVADSFAYNALGTIKVAINATSIDSTFLDAISGWTDSTVTRLAASPTKRFRIAYVHDSRLRPTAVSIDTVAGIVFPSRKLKWDSGTGLPDTVVLGTKIIAFGFDNEGRRDSTRYEGALLRRDTYSSIHTRSATTYNNVAIDSAFWQTAGYDSLGRISSVNRHNGTGTAVDKYEYAKDGALSRLEALTTASSVNSCTGVGIKNDFGASCLSLPNLLQTALLGLKYDSVKNLLEERDSLASTSKIGKYALGNRDTSWAGISYTYDLDGNMLRRRSGADSVRFYWSADNRLDSVNSGGLRTEYEYNAMGQLVTIRRSGVAQRFLLWGGGQILVELNGSLNGRVAEYAYVPNATDGPLALMTGAQTVSATRYFQQDLAGNVRGLVFPDTIAQHIDYSPWGIATLTAGSALADTSRLRWKGLPWIGDSTQLYFVRARWYDPNLRRFVSEDPQGITSNVNQYAFGSNDPIGMSDPEGTGDCRFIPGTMEDNGVVTDVPIRVCAHDGGDPGVTVTIDGWSSDGSSSNALTFDINNSGPLKGPWKYGHYCGRGGMGPTIDDMGTDAACMNHDACYGQYGFSVMSNYDLAIAYPAIVVTALQGCNQDLCDAVRAIGSAIRKNPIGVITVNQLNESGADIEINFYFTWLVPQRYSCHL
jgi:RHS repeat-associated protein